MKKTLDKKDLAILKGKVAGKTSKQIAKEVFPDSPNGDVAVRKRLQKATMREAVHTELMRDGLTLADVLSPVKKALRAKNRTVEYKTTRTGRGNDTVVTTEPVVHEEDNISLQLQGHDRAVKLLGIDKMHDVEDITPPLDDEELKALAGAADEVELTRILFKKKKA